MAEVMKRQATAKPTKGYFWHNVCYRTYQGRVRIGCEVETRMHRWHLSVSVLGKKPGLIDVEMVSRAFFGSGGEIMVKPNDWFFEGDGEIAVVPGHWCVHIFRQL